MSVGRVVVAALVALGAHSCAPGNLGPRWPEQLPEQALLPAHVRLLSNAELERSALTFLGLKSTQDSRLPPEVRQSGYTRNVDQPWSSAAALSWGAFAEEQTALAVEQRWEQLWPCSVPAAPACRKSALRQLATRAWRRPLTASEEQHLQQVYVAGLAAAKEATAQARERDAVRLTLSALLQSPSFLYVTEQGASQRLPESPGHKSLGHQSAEHSTAAVVQLSQFELAAALAYTLSGAPPDAALLAAAEAEQLAEPAVRVEQARRILGQSNTRYHFQRFVLEWLEVDRLLDTAKSSELHPQYERLKAFMLEETANFSDEVMVHQGASLSSLLTAGFVSVGPELAQHYGLPGAGSRVASTQRVGVLQQASVLAAHSHPDSTSPIKRGDFVLRRVLCETLPRPAELGIEVVMPRPQPNETGRERFSRHVFDPACQDCHRVIDPLGFTFEQYDAAGQLRTLDAGKPVATQVAWRHQGQSVQFKDSVQLSHWLAKQDSAQACFARQAFRYFSAQNQPQAEAAFLQVVQNLAPHQRSSLIEMLVAYVSSDLFLYRRRAG